MYWVSPVILNPCGKLTEHQFFLSIFMRGVEMYKEAVVKVNAVWTSRTTSGMLSKFMFQLMKFEYIFQNSNYESLGK